MSDPQHNNRLNTLLIRVHRSLLQYAVECWPWTDVDAAAEQATIETFAREQESSVARMTELLVERESPVDFGSFPDWSELHYVALDYLLGKLIADEERLVAEIEAARPALRGDRQAEEIVNELLVSERQRLSRIRQLAAANPAPA